MAYHTPTIDIKLAAILVTLGVPLRDGDPVTCVTSWPNGRRHDQYTFWFCEHPEIRKFIDAYYQGKDWNYSLLGAEHDLHQMQRAFFNRETLLGWIRDKVTPFKIIESGDSKVLMPVNASPDLKAKIKKHI